MQDLNPLIISGAPRSGTSLLYNLLDGHSDVNWLVDEGFLFEYIDDIGTNAVDLFVEAVPDNVDALVAGLRDKQMIPPLDQPYTQTKSRGSVSEVRIEAPWNEAAFRNALAQPRGPGLLGLWRHLVVACLAGMQEPLRRFACLKSPDFGKSVYAAVDALAETRGIVIVRDPLSAIDSLKRSRELRSEKLLTWPLLARHVRSFQQMQARIDSLEADRVHTVRYETLVASPRETMQAVADWLGIPFEGCMERPTMRGEHWPGISSFEVTNGIEPTPAERPIQALTSDETDFITRNLSDFRQRHSYA